MPYEDEIRDDHDANWPLLIGSYLVILLALAAVGFLVVTL